jgi:Nif-specific regulatory protein
MSAELVVISGPRAGERYTLGPGELVLGRAPSCAIVLNDSAAAWRHCAVRPAGDAHEIIDFRSSGGTFVNGMREARRILEDGDQIAIGDNIIAFADKRAPERADAGIERTLLRVCSLLFAFRALAQAEDSGLYEALETQIGRLMCDLIPCHDATALLGRSEHALVAAANERNNALAAAVAQACRHGVTSNPGTGWIAAPLYAHGALHGVIGAWVKRLEPEPLEQREQTISAIAALAAAALEVADETEALRVEKTHLEERAQPQRAGLIGESAGIRRVLQMVYRVAPLNTTVLITGESGTGKELVARAIHDNSGRRSRPFIAVNCAALTESLLESELFGHEKGAFTGALAKKKGKFEIADGGTVFLDEIGELAPSLQAKLLRVLQQREFERVGGTATLTLDVRVIAATNRDLAVEAQRKAFREDLYHRLNVVTIRIPPLRERPEDILPLARLFAERAARRCGRRLVGFSSQAEALLLSYCWPGNVRELENAIERAVVLGETDHILLEDLPETVLDAARAPAEAGAFHGVIGQAKREAIIRAWSEANGNYKGAAELLGLHPNSLLRLIRNLGLRELLRSDQGR